MFVEKQKKRKIRNSIRLKFLAMMKFLNKSNLPFSHTIDSMGYPATGHLIYSCFPATAETVDMGLTYGSPEIENYRKFLLTFTPTILSLKGNYVQVTNLQIYGMLKKKDKNVT